MAKDNPNLDGGDNAHRVATNQLRGFVERIERLEEEKKAIADDIKGVKAEAKAAGYTIKVFNEMIALRKMDEAKRDEYLVVRQMYGSALGIFG